MKPETGSLNPVNILFYFKAQIGGRFLLGIALAFSLSAAGPAYSANFVKADNSTALNVSGSWTPTGLPGRLDTAVWDNTFSPVNNNADLGGSAAWSGILVGNNLQSAFTINATGVNTLTVGTNGINMVAANQNFVINSPLIQGSNETWIVNSGQSLTLNGPVNGGTATANSTFNLTTLGSGTVNFNGNYSEAGNLQQGQNLLINSNTININPGPTGSFVSGKKLVIGNIAGSSTIVNILSGTNSFTATNYVVMCDNASATAVLNISGGQTTFANSSQSFANALKGTGVVNVATSVVIFGPNTRVAIGSDQANGFTGADGTLNINNAGTVVATAGAQYFSLGNGGPSSFGKGHLNLNSGGTLISARNIIKNQANASGFVTFNGGTLKVGLSSATFMQGLTTATISTNGGTIDDGGFTATIAQPLLHDATVTTDGGLIKQGAGILTLAGTNTYNGPTAINAGTLVIAPAGGGAPGDYTVASGAGLIVKGGAVGSALVASSISLNAGSALTLNETNLSAPLIFVTNTFSVATTTILNLTNMSIVAGQYPLIKYGTLGGAGISGLVLGSTPSVLNLVLSLTNNTANQSIDLLAVPAASILTWDGTAGGIWDISGTANWQGGAFYTETAGVGPIANFDDSASGTTAITLGTTVSPTGIIVSNNNLSYSISGSGQIIGNCGLLKQGSGMFTLATANTFTNVTSIVGGTLQLGDGTGNNGSVGGGIVNNAALVIANPNPQTINNAISGNGTLTKSGNGTLTLTSSNTISGSVSINSGTLALNQGGAGGSTPVLGLVSGVNIAAGANLWLAGANALGVTNNPPVIISGGGTLSVTGSGSHTIGSLALGDSSGGTINGSGVIVVNGNLTNFANTTVSPRNLTVGGTNILLANGSTLTVVSNFTLVAPAVSTQELISGDPNSGPGTLLTKGNININHGVELEYLSWNIDLGTNVMNMTGKLTIGKIPGLPVSMDWISGTGLWAPNDYFAVADSIANNPGSIGELDVTGGSLTISNTAFRCLIGNGGAGTIHVSGGSLLFAGPTSIQLGGDISFSQNGASGTLTISDSGSVTIGPASLGLSLAANNGTAIGITGTINLNGGTLTTWPKIANGATNVNGQSYINFNGGTLKAGTNNSIFLQGLTQATVQSGGAIIDDGGHNITIGQALVDGGGGLTKLGAGTLVLTNASTYSGGTTVSNGTLVVNGSISGAGVNVVQGTLGGSGTIGAAVTINPGSSLMPGTNGLGTLTVNGNLNLGGSLSVAVNKSVLQSNGLTVVSGTLANTGSGMVAVTNLGPSLVVGDTFQLFNQPVANGNTLSIVSNDGVTWTNMLAINGTIQVLNVAPVINPLPGVVQFNYSNGTLFLAWPTNLGWILQAQTNNLSVGLNTNWVSVPGSAAISNLSVNPNPANGAVFYRLAHP